jgi:hypothetical protein
MFTIFQIFFGNNMLTTNVTILLLVLLLAVAVVDGCIGGKGCVDSESESGGWLHDIFFLHLPLCSDVYPSTKQGGGGAGGRRRKRTAAAGLAAINKCVFNVNYYRKIEFSVLHNGKN